MVRGFADVDGSLFSSRKDQNGLVIRLFRPQIDDLTQFDPLISVNSSLRGCGHLHPAFWVGYHWSRWWVVVWGLVNSVAG
jgi:hypothetical protein